MVYNSFYMLLGSVCYYFVEDIFIFISKEYWPMVFFSCDVCICFGIRIAQTSQNKLGSALFSLEKFVVDWY